MSTGTITEETIRQAHAETRVVPRWEFVPGQRVALMKTHFCCSGGGWIALPCSCRCHKPASSIDYAGMRADLLSMAERARRRVLNHAYDWNQEWANRAAHFYNNCLAFAAELAERGKA